MVRQVMNMKLASEKLLSKPEGQTFDRKAAEYDLKKIANVLISYANADGGTVAIGIKDKQFEGINHLDEHKINDMIQIGINLIKPALDVKHEFQKVKVNGIENRILLLKVLPEGEQIFTNTKEEVYLRVGDETKKLTYKQIESLHFSKGIRSYEKELVDDALLEDLNQDLLNEYKEINEFKGDDIWKLLFSKGLAGRDMKKDNEHYVYKLNVAGVLMFANTPSTFIPGARVRFIRYDGTQAGVGEKLNVTKEEVIDKPLPLAIERAEKIVRSQLRTFSSMDENGKFKKVPEYPEGTWLEGIVNAVTHRAYNLNGDDIRIIMYDDRIIFHSPGKLPSIVNTNNIRTTHYSRNPRIARALSEFGWVKEFGEGVDRMYKKMEKYFLDDPEYKVSFEKTELILRNNIIARNVRVREDLNKMIDIDLNKLTSLEQNILLYAYEHKELRPKEFIDSSSKKYAPSTVRRTISKLVSSNLLERHSETLTSPNTYYTLNESGN